MAAWLLGAVGVLAAAMLAWILLGVPQARPPSAALPPTAAVQLPVQSPPLLVLPPAPPAPSPPTGATGLAQAAAPDRPPAVMPSFDIVRVSPRGEAVLAGRGLPGAQVTIADNGHMMARAQANAQGQWVALPVAPLAAGGHQLTLSAEPARPGRTDRPGETQAQVDAGGRGAAPVIVLLPVPGQAAPSGPVAVLAPESGMPRLLQEPGLPLAAGGAAASSRLGLGIVDYDARGAIRFAGTAPPGSTVRMYVDHRPLGDALADPRGRWMLQPGDAVGVGQHQLRLDQLASSGAVAARVALPFDRVLLPDAAVLDGSVVVQPGQNLWRIARHAYGRGVRYIVIYLANRSQIRNPALIYPGQVFAVPAAAGASVPKPNPASSSAAR